MHNNISGALHQCGHYFKGADIQKVLQLLHKYPDLKSCIIEDLCLVRTAIVCGASLAHIEVLLKAGVNPNVVDSCGSIPLIEAAAVGDLQLAVLLMQHGANVNHVTKNEESALSFACANDQFQCAEMLIHSGADLNRKFGNPPYTVLDLSQKYASQKTIELLLRFGARKA